MILMQLLEFRSHLRLKYALCFFICLNRLQIKQLLRFFSSRAMCFEQREPALRTRRL